MNEFDFTILSLFYKYSRINTKGNLVEIITNDVSLENVSHTKALDSVLRLAQQGYLIQILNDNNIPFEITHSGRIKFERESELNASLIEEKALRKAKLKTEIDLNNKNLKGEPWYRKWEALAVI
jgi:hypothetical protein